MKRIISKFKATRCLEDRPCSSQSSTRANAAQTVQEEMKTVASSSTHGEVRAREVTRCTVIPYIIYYIHTIWVALWHTLLCYPYKIQYHQELLLGDFVKPHAHLWCGHFKRWRKMTIGCLTLCRPTKQISHLECLSTSITAEFGLLKIKELSCNSTVLRESCSVVLIHHLHHYRALFLRGNVEFWLWNC